MGTYSLQIMGYILYQLNMECVFVWKLDYIHKNMALSENDVDIPKQRQHSENMIIFCGVLTCSNTSIWWFLQATRSIGCNMLPKMLLSLFVLFVCFCLYTCLHIMYDHLCLQNLYHDICISIYIYVYIYITHSYCGCSASIHRYIDR